MTVAVAVLGWLGTCVMAWAEIRPAPVAVAVAALAVLPWGWLAARASVWRASVVGHDLRLRTIGRTVSHPLSSLDTPVLATVDRWEALHLRLAGGVHLRTLSAPFWGDDAVRTLADRLGAHRVEIASRAELVRRYPGSLTFWRRHRGWGYALYALSVVVAVLLLGSILR